MKRWPAIAMDAATTVILASLACSRASEAPFAPTLSPIATPSAVRSPGPELSVAGLKYLLIHQFGGVFVAEPVVLPRKIRLEQARNAMPVIRDNGEEFQAILQELGIEDAATLTDEQRLLVFDEKTKLNHVRLEPSENAYAFELVIGERNDRSDVKGTVDHRGTITVHSNEPSMGRCLYVFREALAFRRWTEVSRYATCLPEPTSGRLILQEPASPPRSRKLRAVPFRRATR